MQFVCDVNRNHQSLIPYDPEVHAVLKNIHGEETGSRTASSPHHKNLYSVFHFLQQLYMAIWPTQHSTTRARIGPGTIGMSTKGHDDIRARAVPALRAALEAHHEHEANFSCRAGTRQGRWHDEPSVPCQPKARHQFSSHSTGLFTNTSTITFSRSTTDDKHLKT
jgi:hypothetical protein